MKKISLILAVLGILILIILSVFYEPKLTKIKDLNSNKLNQKIKVEGKIISSKKYSNFYINKLKDSTSTIDILTEQKIQTNKTLEVIGVLKEYKDSLQISADKIVLKN